MVIFGWIFLSACRTDAMPKNQAALFALAKTMEDALTAAGVPVNHPRKSLFHMTLARVTRAYPVDAAVESIRAKEFGTHRLCEFTVAGQRVRASDC